MQFSGEANNLDLYSDCRDQCGIENGDGGATPDTTSYPIKKFTRNANFGLDRANTLILKADGWNFPYDDANQTGELLDVSQTFTSGTQKISMQASWLIIQRVRITDPSGNKITLPEADRKSQGDGRLNATAGTPCTHFKLGNYLYFDVPTNYAGTVEVQFQRGPSYFAYTDTTKAPGFATQFHRLISLYAALDYCKMNYLADRVAALRLDIGTPPDLMNNQAGSGMEKELVDFYSRRDEDAKTTLSPRREDYGQMGMGSGIGMSNFNPRGF